jgi:hypothetical protein
MALMASNRGPRKGISAGHNGVDKTLVNYTVVAEITNGTRILGIMRYHGDTFDAIPRTVSSWVLQEVIKPTAEIGH